MLLLNKLEVRHVRGIAGLGPDLNLTGKSLILLGDNATGKSSYIDALEYLLTRQCTSLDINRDGVNWDEGGLHILADAKNLSIKGEFTHSTGTHLLDHKIDLSGLTSPLKEWIKAAEQRCFLLRRRTLLRLIEAKPKERYDALSSFFALDKFTAFESNIKSISDEVDNRLQVASRNVTIQEDLVRRAFNVAYGAVIDETTILVAVNQRLAAAGKQPIKDLDGAKKLQNEVAEELKNFSGVEQAVKLETIIQSLKSIPISTATLEALESLLGMRTKLEELERQLTHRFTVEVLEKGRTWIIEGNLKDCPLCEQTLKEKDEILARIAARVQECRAVIETRASIQKQLKLYIDSLTDIKRACAAAQKIWAEKLGQEAIELTKVLQELQNVINKINQELPSSADIQSQLISLRSLHLDATFEALTERLKGQLKAIGGIDQYKNLSVANQALSTLTVSWPLLMDARNKQTYEQKLKKLIEKVITHAIQARKDTVQTILIEIADEANRIYGILHPNEKIGDITLKVPSRGQGSIDMESQFFGKRGDARAYFSESHLDTLGVALFLALRKKQSIADPHFKLLVLDDVLHSVDSRHRQRAARLIINEFRDHQFIITTHDPIWFNLLQESVNDLGLREEVIFRRISDWTLEGGPIWGDHEAEYEFLKSSRIDTAQPADIAAKTGRLLEEMLKPLCDQLRLYVLFRHNRRYDLGALWPAFKSTSLKHPGFSDKHKVLIEEIDQTDWVRNETGAHSNSSPAPTTTEEAKKFAKAVITLYENVRDRCGRFIEEVDAPKGDWVCRCGNLRYPKRTAASAETS